VASGINGGDFFATENLKEARRSFEESFIQRKLQEQNYNITRTAEVIGVTRSYLHKKLKGLEEEA
jgi:two-component system nitrogen regulation response regulator NtrX